MDNDSNCELDFRSCKAEETGANLEDKPEIGVISALKDNTVFSRYDLCRRDLKT